MEERIRMTDNSIYLWDSWDAFRCLGGDTYGGGGEKERRERERERERVKEGGAGSSDSWKPFDFHSQNLRDAGAISENSGN